MPRRTDYQAITDSLIAHERTGKPVLPKLRQLCPELTAQIQFDAQHRTMLDLWGESVNFDEISEVQIVSHGIMSAIGELVRIPCDDSVIHAGLQHTYGYLLSALQTPFGFKRDRWIQDTIEAGFGLRHPALRPWPVAGSLLLNATYFLGRIAFRDTNAELALLLRHQDMVAPDVVDYPYRRLNVIRVVERVTLPQTAGKIDVHIDFVELPQATSEPRHVLVYSIIDERVDRGSLITAFPVTCDFLAAYRAEESLGEQVPLRTRFNAFVKGWTGTTLIGQRFD